MEEREAVKGLPGLTLGEGWWSSAGQVGQCEKEQGWRGRWVRSGQAGEQKGGHPGGRVLGASAMERALEALLGREGSGPHTRRVSHRFYQRILSDPAWPCSWSPSLIPGPALSGSYCLR